MEAKVIGSSVGVAEKGPYVRVAVQLEDKTDAVIWINPRMPTKDTPGNLELAKAELEVCGLSDPASRGKRIDGPVVDVYPVYRDNGETEFKLSMYRVDETAAANLAAMGI
jgi:hypothetical protein